jgi:hypothetical protein
VNPDRPADFDDYVHRQGGNRIVNAWDALTGQPPRSLCGFSLELLPGETGAPAGAPNCPDCTRIGGAW